MLTYREFTPHASLQNHVKCFWIMERTYTKRFPAEDVTPDAFIELILNFGSPYVLREQGSPDREMPPAILVGLLRKPAKFYCRGTVKLVATRFFAWGARPFLATGSRGALRLRTELAPEWTDLMSALAPMVDRGDYSAAVSIVQDHLIEQLLVETVDQATIRAAAQLLHLRQGRVRLAELAEHCDLSVRQVQRRFHKALGVSPKSLARAIRFEEIRKRLLRDPDQSLTPLAHEFGYTDQAHFIHDFKKFADRTPGAFAQQMRSLRREFDDHRNVVFLQAPATSLR